MMQYSSLKAIGLVATLFTSVSGLAVDRSENPECVVKERQDNTDSTSGFRYLNSETQVFRVTSLPDIPYNVGELYSGNIPVDTDPSTNYFFIFQPTVGPPVDEITIYLNGGPGASSSFGFLEENGRFIWAAGMIAPQLNQYSWVNLTNVLWVDQPAGTGFSQGALNLTNEVDLATRFNSWFLNFQNKFGIKNYKIYVTGESYAGRYVPYIAKGMIDQNDTKHFNLSGIMTIDGDIGNYDYTQSKVMLVDFLAQYQYILNLDPTNLTTIQGLDNTCGYAAFRGKYYTFPASGVQPPVFFSDHTQKACDIWTMAVTCAASKNPCLSIYNIATGACPLQADILNSYNLAATDPGTVVYFNRSDVKEAMHAPNIAWVEVNNKVFTANESTWWHDYEPDSSPDPAQGVLPAVIDHTQRVLVTTGSLDILVQAEGTLLAIQNMTWGGQLGFQTEPSTPFIVNLPDLNDRPYWGKNDPSPGQGTMGIKHFERGLMWTQVYQSGHMTAHDQPRVNYRQLEWMLGRIETL